MIVNNDVQTEVYITKYALTKGVFNLKGRTDKQFPGTFIASNVKNNVRYNNCYHGEGKEWCRTEEEAIAIAEDMKKKKIRNLEKQIEKLRAMKFEIKEK